MSNETRLDRANKKDISINVIDGRVLQSIQASKLRFKAPTPFCRQLREKEKKEKKERKEKKRERENREKRKKAKKKENRTVSGTIRLTQLEML